MKIDKSTRLDFFPITLKYVVSNFQALRPSIKIHRPVQVYLSKKNRDLPLSQAKPRVPESWNRGTLKCEKNATFDDAKRDRQNYFFRIDIRDSFSLLYTWSGKKIFFASMHFSWVNSAYLRFEIHEICGIYWNSMYSLLSNLLKEMSGNVRKKWIFLE